jgi:hypothetical protein
MKAYPDYPGHIYPTEFHAQFHTYTIQTNIYRDSVSSGIMVATRQGLTWNTYPLQGLHAMRRNWSDHPTNWFFTDLGLCLVNFQFDSSNID